MIEGSPCYNRHVFNVGLGELLVIFGFVLVFWGPQALPEIGKNLGKFVRSMRDFARDVRGELGPAAAEFDEIKETVDSIKNPIAAFAKEMMDPAPPSSSRKSKSKAYAARTDEDDYLAGIERQNEDTPTQFDSEEFERSYAAKAGNADADSMRDDILADAESEMGGDDYLADAGKADK